MTRQWIILLGTWRSVENRKFYNRFMSNFIKWFESDVFLLITLNVGFYCILTGSDIVRFMLNCSFLVLKLLFSTVKPISRAAKGNAHFLHKHGLVQKMAKFCQPQTGR